MNVVFAADQYRTRYK